MRYKLIQIDKELLLLDLNGIIAPKDYFLYNNQVRQAIDTDLNVVPDCTKIIASSYIKDLPSINTSIEEIRVMIENKKIDLLFDDVDGSVKEVIHYKSFILGYKSNKTVYTTDEVDIMFNTLVSLLVKGKTIHEAKPIVIDWCSPKINCFVEINSFYEQEDDTIITDNMVQRYKITKIL